MKLNQKYLDQLIKHVDDIIYDKTQNDLTQWIEDYGGRIGETHTDQFTVTFGSTYALRKMLVRRDKDVVRQVLIGLGLYEEKES